jgi:glycosyltransferase involved in cell wall biosynthesis
MKPTSILVLFGNVPLYGNERANIETLSALQRAGAEVLFLIRSHWTKDTIQPELTRQGLKFVEVPYSNSVRYGVSLWIWLTNVVSVFSGSFQLLRLLRANKATHIHVGSTAWILNFLPALWLTRVPLVFRAGDVPPQHHLLWRLVWKFSRRRAAVIVCDSNFVREELVALGADPKKCRVIYAPAPARANEPQRRVRKATSQLTVLYVGQITQSKGIDLLVRVAERLVREYPVKFVVAGDYSWKNPMGWALVDRVAQSGLAKVIAFTGFVSDIDRLYADADLHVVPSVWPEPYGLTVLESKQRAVASVVFPVGGLRETVEHGVDGWVCATATEDELEHALRYYFERPQLCDTQGQAAYLSLTCRLKVHEYAARWTQVYDAAE